MNTVIGNFANTFPPVQDHFGTMSATVISSLLKSSILGHQAHFFNGDVVRLGDDVSLESLTATCMKCLPRQVYVRFRI